MGFNVIMNAKSINTYEERYGFIRLLKFEFHQVKKIPSYAMLIIVGSLKKEIITNTSSQCINNTKCNLWAEKKHIYQSRETFIRIMKMWSIFNNLYTYVGNLTI